MMVSRSLYRLLLRLCPPDLRAEFGAEMEALFLAEHRASARVAEKRVCGRGRSGTCCVTVSARGRIAGSASARPQPTSSTTQKGSRMETLRYDLRHAVRTMFRQKATTAIILLTLALAIGANTAVFSAVHAVLVKPLPYTDPDGLVDGVREAPGRRRVYEFGLAGRLSRLGAAQSIVYCDGCVQRRRGGPHRQRRAGAADDGDCHRGLLRRLWCPGPSRAHVPARRGHARPSTRGRDRACVVAAALRRRPVGRRPPHRAQRHPVRSDRRPAA